MAINIAGMAAPISEAIDVHMAYGMEKLGLTTQYQMALQNLIPFKVAR